MRNREPHSASPPPEAGQEEIAQPLQTGGTGQSAWSPCTQLDERHLRDTIARLQEELADRQADPRPMPSSVMRAYQALIDKNFAELARLTTG